MFRHIWIASSEDKLEKPVLSISIKGNYLSNFQSNIIWRFILLFVRITMNRFSGKLVKENDMLKKFLMPFFISSLFFLLIGCSMFDDSKKDVESFAIGNKASEAEDTWLYPAYIKQNNINKWGYINKKGNFVIQPAYDLAGDFYNNGLAVIKNKDLYGLIDKKGSIVLETEYKYITYIEENLFTAGDYKTSKLVDTKGKVLYELEGNIGKFSNGLSVVGRKKNSNYEYGYINTEGKVAIEPQYINAYDFSGDKALVKTKDGKNALINKSGEILTTLNYEKVRGFSDGAIVLENNNMFGYLTEEGKILVEAKYGRAEPFSEDYAIVNNSDKYNSNLFGLINKKGEFVINPQYGGIWKVGNNLYAVSEKSINNVIGWSGPKALINKDGKQLTDFKLYDIEYFTEEITSATDEDSTFFIDRKGAVINDLPRVSGIGTMKLMGDLVKAQIDHDLLYMTKDGKKVWQSDDSYSLKDGLTVKSVKYRPDRDTLVYYPQISDLVNKDVQTKINDVLKDKFIGTFSKSEKEDEMYEVSIDTSFTASLNKDLLTVKYNSYYYPIGAAHGQPSQLYYNIDINTGKLYSLSDLFKKDSNYVKLMSEIVRKQIEEKSKEENSMIFKDSYKGIRPDHYFIITKDALKIYFFPYEIGAYAAGFITFDIPYSEITDIIDREGDFWKSFDKNIINNANTKQNTSLQPNLTTPQIQSAIKGYENNIVTAINNNDFAVVEPYLVKDSNLYKSQEDLIPNLSKQGIKEKLVEYYIKEVKEQPDTRKVKVYVEESIAIQYPGNDYSTKQFSYIYTLVPSDDSLEYKLSDIEKWDK